MTDLPAADEQAHLPSSKDLADRIADALTLHRQGKLAEAEAIYRSVLSQAPLHVDALHLLGVIHHQRGENAVAAELLERAIGLDPDLDAVHANYGLVLQALKRPQEALASYNRALHLAPDFAAGYMNRGNALLDLNRPAEAIASYDRALKLKPNMALALVNRGTALEALGRHQEALTDYDSALQLKPDDPLALNNRANALRDLKRYGESANSFARLIAIDPNYDYAWGYKFFSQLYGCDWSAYDATRSRIMVGVERGERADTPFTFLAHCESAPAQLKCARTYIAHKHPPSSKPLWSGERYRHDKIRLAYVSADFHGHATSRLIAELFELHDTSRFESWAISLGPNEKGEMRERLECSFYRFVNTQGSSDRDVAQLLREQEIDIAVDLKGLTESSRTGIFAHRAAPVQVSYLGYPGTMGADYIDYLIADPHVVPPSHDSFYSEKIIRLPDTYQANDRKRPIAEHTPTRAELALPGEGVVFCCFNNNYKITPAVFDGWMRLLKRVEPSVLWLLQDNPEASRNLTDEAERRGVRGTRLVFAPRIGLAEHLARQRQADLFLDTFPCNAHTTASDALWAGLPILTCMGDSFASRVAGSLLNAVGLPELIAHSLHDYEALAFTLATEPGLLAQIRSKLARNRATHPLFDTDRFRRHIESAYIEIYRRYQSQEPPAAFDVAPDTR